MSDSVLYISEREVVDSLKTSDAIKSLKSMLLEKGKGEGKNVAKSLGVWGNGSSMHSLGSFMDGSGFAGFKTWVRTNQGGGSLFSLFDAHKGTLLAIIEARALGLLRTSAMTGVGTQLLAPPDAGIFALIGTGVQAEMQLRALSEVFSIKELRVYSPTADHRDSFVSRMSKIYTFSIVSSESLSEATSTAEVVTLMTRAEEPFLSAADLSSCRLLNAMGSILPKKAEFHQDVFDLTSNVIVDDIENARKGSKELREKFGTTEEWTDVNSIDEVLGNRVDLKKDGQMILFKAMGMGLSDLAVAQHVYRTVKAKDLGIKIPAQTRENLLFT